MMKVKSQKWFAFLIFIFVIKISNAQSPNTFISNSQLLYMQTAPLEEIRSFLSLNNWNFDGQTNQPSQYFNYTLDYTIVKWQKYNYYGGIIYLFYKQGVPNIVIYQCNKDCFQSVLTSESALGKATSIVEDVTLISSFTKPKGVAFECREYNNQQYSILIYNKASLLKSTKIAEDREKERIKAEEESMKVEAERKKAEEERLKIEQEKEDRYQAVINEGDRLLAAEDYEGAIAQYVKSKLIKPDDYLYNEKIKGVQEAKGDKFIRNGNVLSASGKYDEAIAEYNKARQYKSDASIINNKIEKQKEYKIKSITYDLEKYDPAKYESFKVHLTTSILAQLSNYFYNVSYNEISGTHEKYYSFQNTYSAKYKLVYNNSGNTQDNTFKLKSGSDKTCEFIKFVHPTIPTIKYQGYEVLTEATIQDIDVYYVKGITRLKVHNGKVKFKKNSPPKEVQIKLAEEFKYSGNGLFKVNYEYGKVMGVTSINVDKQKIKSTGSKILRGTGTVLLVLVVTILGALSQ